MARSFPLTWLDVGIYLAGVEEIVGIDRTLDRLHQSNGLRTKLRLQVFLQTLCNCQSLTACPSGC